MTRLTEDDPILEEKIEQSFSELPSNCIKCHRDVIGCPTFNQKCSDCNDGRYLVGQHYD